MYPYSLGQRQFRVCYSNTLVLSLFSTVNKSLGAANYEPAFILSYFLQPVDSGFVSSDFCEIQQLKEIF